MRIKIDIAYYFLIVWTLSACALQGSYPSRADNFSFVFQFLPCDPVPVVILDTDSATLSYRRIGEASYATIPIQITEAQLESIYQTALSIGFFDYPEEFEVPEDEIGYGFSPASSYQLSMTNGETTNTVLWNDNVVPISSNRKAEQLRALIILIEKVIQAHPETHAIEDFEVGCVP